MDFIQQEWLSHGPFDGLVGFSQGTVMAHLLTESHKSSVYPWLSSLKFGIFVAGFPSRMHPNLNGQMDEQIDLPSLHISGQEDTHVPPSYQEELSHRFVNPTWYSHHKGHILPQTAETIEAVSAFLQRFRVQDVNSTATAPSQNLSEAPQVSKLAISDDKSIESAVTNSSPRIEKV